MKILFIVLLLMAAPAWAVPTSWDFTGTLPLGGTVTGAFQYDSTEAPLALNVRGLSNSTTYALTDFALTITPSTELLPYIPEPISFTPSTSTAEFCLNSCLFGSGTVESFLFNNGQYKVRMVFDTSAIGPLAAPPSSQEQWGSLMLNASEIKPVTAGGPFALIMMQSGSMQAVAVPEVGSLWLLLVGLVGVLSWRGVAAQRAR